MWVFETLEMIWRRNLDFFSLIYFYCCCYQNDNYREHSDNGKWKSINESRSKYWHVYYKMLFVCWRSWQPLYLSAEGRTHKRSHEPKDPIGSLCLTVWLQVSAQILPPAGSTMTTRNKPFLIHGSISLSPSYKCGVYEMLESHEKGRQSFSEWTVMFI